MNETAIENRFIFHANAVALAAHIRRPEEFFVSAVASSCLPATGGIGMAEVKGRNHREMISYDAAATSVFGDFTNRNTATERTYGNHGSNVLPTLTVVEGSLTGLRIANGDRHLEVGHLKARMESRSDRKSPTKFDSLSATFDGIKIDNSMLTVTTHCDVFAKYDTKEKLCRAYKEDAEFRAAHAEHFYSVGPKRRCWFGKPKPAIPEAQGTIVGTVVTSVKWEGAGPQRAVITGNRVTIDGFGSIYLGEMVMEEGFRRLTLLRFQLGSLVGGEGSGVDIQSNGTTWPPR